MYNAPAVTYPVGRSRFQAGLTLAVVLAGAVTLGAWWLSSTQLGAGQGMGWVLWLVFAAWVVGRGLNDRQMQLVWDGRDWRLNVGALNLAVTPQVILDAQHTLLLRLRPETGFARWVWPAQRTQPERWLALRRALFNPAARPEPSRVAVSPEV